MKGNLVNKSGDLVKDLVNDCISSQAAKDMIKNHKTDFSTEKDYRTAMACVNALPSAQPEITNEEIRFALKQLRVYFAIKIRDGKDGGVPVELLKLVEEIQEYFENAPSAQPGWIPVTKRLPENEQDVLVTVEARPSGRKPFRRVVRAFYTDGKHTDADSAYTWYELEEPDFDDDGNIIVPEGWWESSDYSEEVSPIDDFVISWREQPKPQKGEENG